MDLRDSIRLCLDSIWLWRISAYFTNRWDDGRLNDDDDYDEDDDDDDMQNGSKTTIYF